MNTTHRILLMLFCLLLTSMAYAEKPVVDSHYVELLLPHERLFVNLRALGVETRHDDTGNLKSLSFDQLGTHYRVRLGEERMQHAWRPSLVQRFQRMNGRLLLHGATVQYGEMGSVLSETNWHTGKLHGEQKVYNRFGQLREERQFDRGLPISEWRLYYDDGTLASEVAFPKSAEDWKDNYLSAPSAPSRGIFNHPKPVESKKVEERWYNQDGLLQRSTTYSLSFDGEALSIGKTGESKSFDHYGKVVRDRRIQRGTGRDSQYRPGIDRSAWQSKWWMEGKLFKTTQSSSAPFSGHSVF